MKGKIISVLFCLMLVFGMFVVTCDNGALKEQPYTNDGDNELNVAWDWYLGGNTSLPTSSQFYIDLRNDKTGQEKPDGIPDTTNGDPLSETNNNPIKKTLSSLMSELMSDPDWSGLYTAPGLSNHDSQKIISAFLKTKGCIPYFEIKYPPNP